MDDLARAVCSGELEAVKRLVQCSATTASTINALLGGVESKAALLEKRLRGLVSAETLADELLRLRKEYSSLAARQRRPLAGESTDTPVVGDMVRALHLACDAGNAPIVALLLLKGAAVDGKDELGRTPLLRACLRGNIAVASLLMDAGASANDVDWTHTSALHVAASLAQPALMSLLLQYPHVLTRQNQNGWTPLHVACFMGQTDTVRMLLSTREEFDIPDAEGFAPLHAAVAAGHASIVTMLLQRGCDLPDSAFELARRTRDNVVLEVLDTWRSVLRGDPVKEEGNVTLPLRMPFSDTVPEARAHHFVVEERAVEALSGQSVTFLLRTSPPRLGLRFVVRATVVSTGAQEWGSVVDLRNGQYLGSYRHVATAGLMEVSAVLVEGGQLVARRWFSVDTVVGRVVVAKCIGYGPALYNPQQGVNTFTVQAMSQTGAPLKTGGAQWVASLTLPDRSVVPLNAQDNGDGTYTVRFELGDKGVYNLECALHGHSIRCFPVSLDMDWHSKFALLAALRRLEEDIDYFNSRLQSVQPSAGGRESDSKAKMRSVVERLCVECHQRHVAALVLPCRHYRYCVECAQGAYVLESKCHVCDCLVTGFLRVHEVAERNT